MKTRLNLTSGIPMAVLVLGGLAGCAHTAPSPPSEGTSKSIGSETAVVDAVLIPTAETRPDDVPEGLLAAEAADPNLVTPTMAEIEAMQVYRIGPTDILGFRSFDDPTLDTDNIQVRHDGNISLPWVPDLKVAGLTRDEATTIVQDAYKELYYEAEVSLQIIQATSRTYSVTGDVNAPGPFAYTKPINLLEAIITAGSLRVNQRGGDSFVGGQGQLVKAFVIRGTGEDRQALEYDLRGLEKSGTHDSQALILPDDIIYIPNGLNLVYVLGEVGRPGIQPLSEGMTLLQLLASASGFNESAARLKQVVLIREANDNETEVQLINIKELLKTGADMLIQPGDILYVPRKRLISIGEFVSRATGVVSPIISVTSQALGLYSQAWDAFYADERVDLLYNSDNSGQVQTNLQLLEAIRQVGSAAEALNSTSKLGR